jgi:hypothetical protein
MEDKAARGEACPAIGEPRATRRAVRPPHPRRRTASRLLLPYRRRFSGDDDPPDHENGWVPSSLTDAPAQITGLARLTAASSGTEGFPE